MTSTVDEAALAGALAAILERVRRGERFEIAQDGRVFAVLAPSDAPVGITGRELAARFGDLRMPGDGFADDIEAARTGLLPVRPPEWPD
jgi:antitoxin (DNA-binding transcriptional repressor) of toxin-antitoxin stability system